MKLNTEKSKFMKISFTMNHKFTTIVFIDNVTLDVVDKAKLLGAYVTNY